MHVTPNYGLRGVVATVLSSGISGHAHDPFPPSAEGLSHTGRWPHESISAPAPAAAILLTADNMFEQGLSVFFVYVHLYCQPVSGGNLRVSWPPAEQTIRSCGGALPVPRSVCSSGASISREGFAGNNTRGLTSEI
jgi:hypothetical protein